MYRFIECTKPVDEMIMEINGFSFEDLDISSFSINKEQECLVSFYQKLMELKEERFFIVGDYDFDGISSITIMSRMLQYLNIQHNFYIPSRLKEGYGINTEMVERAHQYDFTVILTLDNGIVAHDAIALAKEYGMKFLIIDHHEYSELPNADAIIHPSLLDDEYKDACTGGLTCLLSTLVYEDDFSFVMGGCATMADMSLVMGYNRWLIQKALHLLNEKNFPLINMLSKKKTYDYVDLSFNVIPKVNAVSRMGYNANLMAKYFLSETKDAMKLADEIDNINIERKECTKEMMNIAETLINDDKIMILSSNGFKEGLCGIVAGRLSDRLMKPVIVLSGKETLKGSGRSFGDFNLYEYLLSKKECFLNYGGHDKAVGMCLNSDQLEELKDYIQKSDIVIHEEEKPVLILDKESLNMDTMEKIESLNPYGTGFKEVLIAVRNDDIQKISGSTYPKYQITNYCDAILFDKTKEKEEFSILIGRLSRNNYKKGTLTLHIEDFMD